MATASEPKLIDGRRPIHRYAHRWELALFAEEAAELAISDLVAVPGERDDSPPRVFRVEGRGKSFRVERPHELPGGERVAAGTAYQRLAVTPMG